MKARSLWVVSGLYLLVAAAMFGVFLPAVTHACGTAPLDGRFSWSAADAAELAVACGRGGLDAYARMQFLDLVYPALLAAVLAGWASRLGARLASSRVLVVCAIALAALDAAFDYLENAAAWTLILTGDASSWVFTIGGVFSAAKNLTGTLAIASVLILVVWFAVDALRRNRSSRSSPEVARGVVSRGGDR